MKTRKMIAQKCVIVTTVSNVQGTNGSAGAEAIEERLSDRISYVTDQGIDGIDWCEVAGLYDLKDTELKTVAESDEDKEYTITVYSADDDSREHPLRKESRRRSEIAKDRLNMTFRDLRQASGLTLKQFAEYFDIPVGTVEMWNAGKRNCNRYLLKLFEYKLRNEGILR